MNAGSNAIRKALAAALQGHLGEIQVSPFMLSDPTPPGAHVYPARVQYDLAFQRGGDLETFIVEVFVSEVSDIGGQELLDDFLEKEGPTSVKEALELDRTLGGLVDALHVTEQSGYRRYLRAGGTPVLGAQWTITVWT